MSSKLVNKLLVSFTKLERTIDDTYTVLRCRPGVPFYVLHHVQQYREMVVKQRGLALELEQSLMKEDWNEVARLIKLINGFSSMIQNDAKALVMDGEPGATGSSYPVM